VNTSDVASLREYLARLPPGEVDQAGEVERLLAACWDAFEGGDAEGMEGTKLHRRTKRVRWTPPILSFAIERHGGTVRGSSRAELHEWELNIDRQKAALVRRGHRQLHPNQPHLDVERIADEVAGLIAGQRPNPWLKWYPDGRVQVLAGVILPDGSAVSQTLRGRRQRLRQAIRARLERAGWYQLRANLYARHEQSELPCSC
jgi:hypothetical protein